MIQVDEAVLRRAVEAIEFDTSQWDQACWADPCGTTACLAGWILATELGKDLAMINQLGHMDSTNDGMEVAPAMALDLLSVRDPEDRDEFYTRVFLHVSQRDEDGKRLRFRGEPAALKVFKERLTEVTGVEF